MNKIVVFSLALLLAHSFASADTSDPSSVLYRGAKRKSNIDYTLSASSFRGFDEFDRLGLNYSAAATMTLKNKQAVSASLSYSHTDDFQAAEPRFWGFEDLRLSYTKSSILISKNKKRRSSLRFSIDLPTSETSVQSGMIFNSSLALPTNWVFGKNTLILSPGVTLSQHRFKTTDAFGYTRNNLLSLGSSLILRRTFFKKLTLSASGTLINYYDYDFNGRILQIYSLSAFMPVTQNLSVTAGYRWRDTYITNNSLFDDDTSLASLGLTYQL